MQLSDEQINRFQATVLNYYRTAGRSTLPWRRPEADGGFDPYKIMVSELMLQQTQVSRVIPKYEAFLRRFPSVHDLAAAPLADVLIAWQGLGYNRRAKFLWQAAGQVVDKYQGSFPGSQAGLTALSGVGVNTAGAIVAYAFDEPVTFVETNIRTVFIHHFFRDQTEVRDRQILDLLAQTLPAGVQVAEPKEKSRNDLSQTNSALPKVPSRKTIGLSRTWYWALMDYGSFLKSQSNRAARQSASYAKQSPFEGSQRAVRGQVLRLLAGRPYGLDELRYHIDDDRLDGVLESLGREQLISRRGSVFSLYR